MSSELITKMHVFLALAFGNRISEFHSVLKGSHFIKFSHNYKAVSIILMPHF